MDELLNTIAALLGLRVETLLLVSGLIAISCNLIGRSIPDSAIGWLGTLRKVCKVLGLYLPNRLTPAVTVNTVGKAVAATIEDSVLREAAKALPEAVTHGQPVGGVADAMARGASDYIGDAIGAGVRAEVEERIDDVLTLTDKAGPFQIQREK